MGKRAIAPPDFQFQSVGSGQVNGYAQHITKVSFFGQCIFIAVQIIPLKKFIIPISIDISIKKHQFVSIRQA